MLRHVIAFTSLSALAFSASACSSSSPGTNPTDGGTGGDGAAVDGGSEGGGGGMVTQKGKIIDFGGTTGVKAATVDLGGRTAMTMDAPMKGVYAIAVPMNTPFFMTVTESTHVKLIEQEWSLSGDYDRMTTSLVPTTLQATLTSGLPGYDMTKGVLAVGITKTGACADEAGATIALNPVGNSKVVYFQGGFPSGSATSVKSGQAVPSAVIYNVEPGAGLQVTIVPPTGCTNVPFPYTDGVITYTGGAKVEGGNASSFLRAFVK